MKKKNFQFHFFSFVRLLNFVLWKQKISNEQKLLFHIWIRRSKEIFWLAHGNADCACHEVKLFYVILSWHESLGVKWKSLQAFTCSPIGLLSLSPASFPSLLTFERRNFTGRDAITKHLQRRPSIDVIWWNEKHRDDQWKVLRKKSWNLITRKVNIIIEN